MTQNGYTPDDASDGELVAQQIVDSADEDQATDHVPAVSLEESATGLSAGEERRLIRG